MYLAKCSAGMKFTAASLLVETVSESALRESFWLIDVHLPNWMDLMFASQVATLHCIMQRSMCES